MRLDLGWEALLDDGGILHSDLTEYDNLFIIEGLRPRIREFRLIDLNDEKRHVLTIHLPTPEHRLVFRRLGEVTVQLAMGQIVPGSEKQKVVGWIAGWQKTVRLTLNGDQTKAHEANAQSIMLIQSDGRIQCHDRTPPGMGINVRPHELEAGLTKAGLTDGSPTHAVMDSGRD